MVTYRDLKDLERLAVGLGELKAMEGDDALIVGVRTAVKVLHKIQMETILHTEWTKKTNTEFKILLFKLQSLIDQYEIHLLFEKSKGSDNTNDSLYEQKNEPESQGTETTNSSTSHLIGSGKESINI